jgi:enoyl-CoA hydratase/carnithine racemase
VTTEAVLVETAEQIGTITLNRPEQMNTFSTPLARELNQALLVMDDAPEVRVVVIAGTGCAFCAGIDLPASTCPSMRANRMADMPLPDALVYSNEMFASLFVTEDAREGVDAFLNKRPAVWKGC